MKKIFIYILCICIVNKTVFCMEQDDSIVVNFPPLTENEVLAYDEYEGKIYAIFSQDIHDPYRFAYITGYRMNYSPANIQFSEDRKYAITGSQDRLFFIDGSKGIIKKIGNLGTNNKQWLLSPDGKFILSQKEPRTEDNKNCSLFVLYDIQKKKIIKEFEWIKNDGFYSIQELIYKDGNYVVFTASQDGEVKAVADIRINTLELIDRFDNNINGVSFGNIDDEKWQRDATNTLLLSKIPELIQLYSEDAWVDIYTNWESIKLGATKEDLIKYIGEPSEIINYPFENKDKSEYDIIEYVYDSKIGFQFYKGFEKIFRIYFNNPNYSISIEGKKISAGMTRNEIESLLGRGRFVMVNNNGNSIYEYFFSKKEKSPNVSDTVQLFYNENEICELILIFESS